MERRERRQEEHKELHAVDHAYGIGSEDARRTGPQARESSANDPTHSKLLPFMGRKLSSSNSCSIMLFKGLILQCF